MINSRETGNKGFFVKYLSLVFQMQFAEELRNNLERRKVNGDFYEAELY